MRPGEVTQDRAGAVDLALDDDHDPTGRLLDSDARARPRDLRRQGTSRLDVVSAGLSGAALGVVGAWLRHDPLPPVDDAAAWMWAVITGAGGSVAPAVPRTAAS